MCWHLGVTANVWVVRPCGYLCYPKHSSQAQTFWRTPHCSQGWLEKHGDIISVKSKRTAINKAYSRYIYFFYLTGPYCQSLHLSLRELFIKWVVFFKRTRKWKKLTSWCCHGRQWYLQWDKTVRRSPWPPTKQAEQSNWLSQKCTNSSGANRWSTRTVFQGVWPDSVSSNWTNNKPTATRDRGSSPDVYIPVL